MRHTGGNEGDRRSRSSKVKDVMTQNHLKDLEAKKE